MLSPAPLWECPAAKALYIRRVSSPPHEMQTELVDKSDSLMAEKGFFSSVVIESHFGQNGTKCKCFNISREPESP